MNLAILGPGKISDRQLAPAIRATPGVQLWSVLSRDLTRAKEFAARHQAAAPNSAFDDLDTLLADKALDAVLVATPDRLHADAVIRAAQAGKHVLCEKPMCTDLAPGREMVEACARAKVRLGVAYHLRFHSGHRALHSQVQQGALGELRHMRVQWTFQADDASNWRASNQVGRWWSLAGVGTHCLDLVRWMMVPSCGEVVEVSSLINRSQWKGPHDETALVGLRFASGATAEVVTSVLFNSPPRVELFGTRAAAIAEGTLGPAGEGTIRVGDTALAYLPVNPYQGEIADFVAAVRDGRDPEVGGQEGLRNVELLLQAAP